MTALQSIPARRIVRAIAGAAERWSDADFPPRVRATDRIAGRTGYAVPVVEYALDRLFFPLDETELRQIIAGELGALEVLDGFHARSGKPDAWARPVGKVCVISSRTTIGVALYPAIFALCAKCDVTVKDREDALVAAFFETLAEELDELQIAAQASTWDSSEAESPDLAQFDAVVAFGSDDVLARIGAGVRYPHRFIGFGSRMSAGYVVRESLDLAQLDALCEGAARDLVLYETEGCLSLHVLFVERGGAVGETDFARRLAEVLERAAVEFPPGRIEPAQSARFGQVRNLAAFRAASGRGSVFGSDEARFALVLDPPRIEPPAFLPRTLGVLPVDDPADALAYLREHRLPLEAFALSSPRSDVVQMAVDAGAVRLARFGELQHPPPGGDHGGRPRIAEFVTWIDRTI